MSIRNAYNRRKFLKTASLFTTGGLLPTRFTFGEISEGVKKNSKSSLLSSESVENKGKAIILETKTICKEPGRFPLAIYTLNADGHPVKSNQITEPNRYLGWPSIIKTTASELIVAYSGDRDEHVCPWGKTRILKSKDNGKIWSDPETINNTPLDDRDAGIIQTQKGTLLVSWFTSLAYADPQWKGAYEKYARVAEKISYETKKQWLGNWVRRSEDGGKTWGEPIRTVATSPHGPIQLRDGRLLYIGNATYEGRTTLVAEQSEDDGQSWEVIATFRTESGSISGIYEPHVVELKNGKLVALFRNEPKDRNKCFLLQSESEDGGKTWTALHETPIWGYPPHLLELKTGWLLVVYGHRREPYSEKACISYDGGKTWDIENEIILSFAPNGDLGYPASVQLDDDSILTVYYQQEIAGEPPSIMSTHWKLP